MRAVLVGVLLAVAACHDFDPIGELDHREYAETGAAIQAILDQEPAPRVYAIGEYHETIATAKSGARSTLDRFNRDILGLLQPHAHHLVVEAWLGDDCASTAAAVSGQVSAATGHAPRTADDIGILVAASARASLVPHGLPMTCIEQGAVVDGRGRVDFLLLLELITDKLGDTTRALLAEDPDRAVIVYGGALHNDLYPRWPLDQLSYAAPLARELGGGGVLELDLVVPEVVAPMALVRGEAWFPLLGLAAPGRTIVWQRGPSSYVVILPAASAAVAAVALPRALD
jgi:hypothetical protein